MNLKFLGDALDHWKGSLFESLQQARVVRDFAVDPMASDVSEWRSDDFSLYAKLLRIQRSQILEHQSSLCDRSAYFREVQHCSDMFLDPDTGVATGTAALSTSLHPRSPNCSRASASFPSASM